MTLILTLQNTRKAATKPVQLILYCLLPFLSTFFYLLSFCFFCLLSWSFLCFCLLSSTSLRLQQQRLERFYQLISIHYFQLPITPFFLRSIVCFHCLKDPIPHLTPYLWASNYKSWTKASALCSTIYSILVLKTKDICAETC